MIGTTTTHEQSHIVWSGKTPQLESRPISAFCFSTHVSEFLWLESEQTIVPGWRNDRCVSVSTTQTSFWGRWRPDDGGGRGCLHPQNKQCDLGLSGSGLWLGRPLKEISNFPLLPFTLCRHLLSPKPGPEASKEAGDRTKVWGRCPGGQPWYRGRGSQESGKGDGVSICVPQQK